MGGGGGGRRGEEGVALEEWRLSGFRGEVSVEGGGGGSGGTEVSVEGVELEVER